MILYRRTSLAALPFVLAMCTAVDAQLTWEVSVKVVRDEHGDRFDDMCVGGANNGSLCDPDVGCPGGACIAQICQGGTQNGAVCDVDSQCPGGECIGDLNTDAEIHAMIDRANAILMGNGPPDVPRTEPRGYQFDLEIIDLYDLPDPPDTVRACSHRPTQYCDLHVECPGGRCVANVCVDGDNAGDPCDPNAGCPACVGGTDHGKYCVNDGDCSGTCSGTASCDQVSHWFYAPISADVRDAIRTAALESPAATERYGWRDDAINIYILGQDGSGTAWWDVSVLLGQDLSSHNTPFHEIGHYFSLYHTHGGGGASPDCTNGHDDDVADTLLDNCGKNCGHGCNGCWCRDDIANENFALLYAQLSAADQLRVNQVYYNLMCYRRRREMLTPDQLDRITDFSNDTAYHVADGRTRFVDLNGPGGGEPGTSASPALTVGRGLSIADPGDIVLIRSGSYDELLTINQDVTLRASRGDAVIGATP